MAKKIIKSSKNNKANLNKNILYYLRFKYGLNFIKIKVLLTKLKLNSKISFKKLKKIDYYKLNKFLVQWEHIDYLLKNKIFFNIKHLIEIKSYKGMRHLLNYPVRNQRTRTNAKTAKRVK